MSKRRLQARHTKRVAMAGTKRTADKMATLMQRIIKGSVKRGN